MGNTFGSGEAIAVTVFASMLDSADEATLFEVADAVRAAFRHRGILAPRASEFDAELADLQRRRDEARARSEQDQAARAEVDREKDLAEAIAMTRRYAGEAWEPGKCAACRADVPGWDANVGGAFNFGVKHLCDACRAKARAQDEARAAAQHREEQRRARERRLAKAWASLPEGFGDVALTSLAGSGRVANREAIDLSRRLVLERRPADPPTLLFAGPTSGVGKTTLALALAEEVIRRGEPLDAPVPIVERAAGVRFYLAANLARARERAKLGAEAHDIEDALSASLLIVDELGGEAARLQDVIEEVITTRAAERRLTIITTGLTGEELAERYTGGFCRKIARDPRCAARIICGLPPVGRPA